MSFFVVTPLDIQSFFCWKRFKCNFKWHVGYMYKMSILTNLMQHLFIYSKCFFVFFFVTDPSHEYCENVFSWLLPPTVGVHEIFCFYTRLEINEEVAVSCHQMPKQKSLWKTATFYFCFVFTKTKQTRYNVFVSVKPVASFCSSHSAKLICCSLAACWLM